MRNSEKSALLVHELMKTYCPEKGYVLDVYAGTMTTAIACLASNRPCDVIKADKECHEIAVGRLLRTIARKEEAQVTRGNARNTRASTASVSKDNEIHLLQFLAEERNTTSEDDNDESMTSFESEESN